VVEDLRSNLSIESLAGGEEEGVNISRSILT
jgi:hypothetical protein